MGLGRLSGDDLTLSSFFKLNNTDTEILKKINNLHRHEQAKYNTECHIGLNITFTKVNILYISSK